MERKIRPDTAKIIGKSSRFWIICAILIIGILCSTVLGAWAHGKIQKTSGQLGKLNPQLEQIKTDYQMAQQNLEELENAVNSSRISTKNARDTTTVLPADTTDRPESTGKPKCESSIPYF